MGELATGIAHDLNQPLTAIGLCAENCLEFLKTDGITAQVLGKKLELISTLVAHCGHFICGLRSFVSRQATTEYSSFDVRDAVRAAIAMVQYQLNKGGFSVHLALSNSPLIIDGNSVHVQQMLLNLILNAIDAVQGCHNVDRRIEVSAMAIPIGVELTVRDYGEGISDEAQGRLFEPFFTTKSNGMGMGLKISQNIVRAHGGSLTFESRAAYGTSFRVCLPGRNGGAL